MFFFQKLRQRDAVSKLNISQLVLGGILKNKKSVEFEVLKTSFRIEKGKCVKRMIILNVR